MRHIYELQKCYMFQSQSIIILKMFRLVHFIQCFIRYWDLKTSVHLYQLNPADGIVQLPFVSLMLLCPPDFSCLYKARTQIQVEFHPEKETPILKGIAQHSATICEVDINYKEITVLIPDLRCQVILYYLFSSFCEAIYSCLTVNCAVCVNVLTD